MDDNEISQYIKLGEGQTIEFKQSFTPEIDKEIVAFANTNDGILLLGVSDKGEVLGTETDNRTISRITDLCKNCDPKIKVEIEIKTFNTNKKVLIIKVKEGAKKPYQCKSGFYTRIGANSQKLTTNEIKGIFRSRIILNNFEKESVVEFDYKNDFDQETFSHFLDISDIKKSIGLKSNIDILNSLGLARGLEINNAGLLLFGKNPEKFIPEACITCVNYKGTDRLNITDREEIKGSIIKQVESAINFLKRDIPVTYNFTKELVREERLLYPLTALREAIVNAVTHRDYSYFNSRIYISIFADRLEIENPGGLIQGLEEKDLGKRSIRRNPLIADCLYRAKLAEKLGSGFVRIKESLKENGNPELQLSTSNFFTLRFYPRVADIENNLENLTDRQKFILLAIKTNGGSVSANEISNLINISQATVLRDLKTLIKAGAVKTSGIGKNIRYNLHKS